MAIVTLILFDSFKVGLIFIDIPLSFAVIVNFGIMGFTGIVLNIGTSLIASFTIGIGIDDTIHFLLNLRKEMKSNNMRYRDLKKEEVEALIYNNLKYTSKAIVFTSLALIFGFMVVIFSTFMPVRNFSILLALTMVNTTIATLMLLSATILIFPRLIKTKKPKPLGSFSGYSRRKSIIFCNNIVWNYFFRKINYYN
jgi:predicted RND superfamily exporter protein